MKRWKRKRDRWGQRGGEKKAEGHREIKKRGGEAVSERQQCQQRGTVVFSACCWLACHQLAWGRCNRERSVIIAVNLPQSTCAFRLLIFTKIQRSQSGFQHFTPVKTDKKKEEERHRVSVSNFCLCPGSVCFLRAKKHILDDNFCFCFFSPPICFYRQHWTFQSDWCVNHCLLSCGVQQLLFAFSTGVCGSHCRRAASCKLQISFHTHDSPIESAYTCNHMLQPSDRSFPLPTGRDKLSPSTVPPCTLNILFRYTWTHFT